MGRVVVDVKDFSFKYRQTKHKALKNVSFQVEEGSFFCIIGSNGSGKSTLCNALVGLIPHYFVGKMSGSVTIDGSVVEDSTIADLSTKIGLVFQNPFNQLSYTAGTVAEELAYPKRRNDQKGGYCSQTDENRSHHSQKSPGAVRWSGTESSFRFHLYHGAQDPRTGRMYDTA